MYELRPEYQVDAHDETINHYLTSRFPAYHDHSVGAGKSVLIAFFAKWVSERKERFLCLSRQGEIAEQNALDAWAIGCKNSIFSASLNKKSTYYPVIFGTEGTVARALKNEFKSIQIDALAIDECHEVDWQDVLDCIKAYKEGKDFYNQKDQQGKPLYSQYALIITHLFVLNPKLKIIGYSGSPFRGSEDILGKFWQKRLSYVPTMQLVGLNYLVPPVFGFGDEHHKYDYSEFEVNNDPNFTGDYSKEQLKKMSEIASKDKGLTQQIIEEVIERTRDRLGVMITCASKKHCEQVAECLPENTWGIVTDSTTTKERREILNKAKEGKIKYVLQINCLGQGVNVPYWCTLVLLRKIGSRRYLTQLTGRVLRLLKDHQIELGLKKFDGLILDYSETFESMGNVFTDDPIISQAAATRAKEINKTKECPKCSELSSEHAVRCCGVDSSSSDGRCDYFFRYNECKSCGAHNAPTAKSCRLCDAVMIDPNKALVNKAYTDADYKPVKTMSFSETKTGKLCVTYELDSVYSKNGEEFPEVAREYFSIGADSAPYEKQRWFKFIEQHINGQSFRRKVAGFRQVKEVITMKAMFDKPKEITHRINDKSFSIINRKRFNSGREALSG